MKRRLRQVAVLMAVPLAAVVLIAYLGVGTRDVSDSNTLELVTEHLVRIGPDSLLSHHSRIVRDHRGRFYAGPLWEPGTVARFHPDGSFDRLLGRRGRGPGELPDYSRDALFLWPGDSIAVVYGTEIHILAPDGTDTRRLYATGIVKAVAFPPDGSSLFMLQTPVVERERRPIVRVDLDDRTEHGFEPAGDAGPRDLRHLFALDTALYVVSTDREQPGTFILTRYALDGPRQSELSFEVPELTGPDARAGLSRYACVCEGQLWMAVGLRPSGSATATEPANGEGRPRRLSVAEERLHAQTLLVVVDVENGRVLQETDWPHGVLRGILPAGYAVSLDEVQGETVFDIWSVAFEPTRRVP